MGSFSNFLEDALLNHVFEGTEYTQPASTWIALTTHVLNDADVGSSLLELDGGAYARRECKTWSKSSSGDGATQNGADLTFIQASADWGKIVCFAICDTVTLNAGNVLAHGVLTISKSVQSGDTPKFAAGDLDVTLD